MASRNRSNTLSLAVLVCLHEKPMHPYEVATTLRQRHKHESVRLNYGSLYSVVESLAKRGLIVAQETERSGRLPERTVYALTDLGREEIVDWLSTLISTPTKEYPSFEAALSFIGALSPDEVVRLLQERALHLEVLIAQWEGTRGVVEKRGLPRLFYIEEEFAKALIERELEFVRDLVDDIVAGTLEGVDFWRRIHAGDGRPELGHGIEVLQEGVTPPWKK